MITQPFRIRGSFVFVFAFWVLSAGNPANPADVILLCLTAVTLYCAKGDAACSVVRPLPAGCCGCPMPVYHTSQFCCVNTQRQCAISHRDANCRSYIVGHIRVRRGLSFLRMHTFIMWHSGFSKGDTSILTESCRRVGASSWFNYVLLRMARWLSSRFWCCGTCGRADAIDSGLGGLEDGPTLGLYPVPFIFVTRKRAGISVGSVIRLGSGVGQGIFSNPQKRAVRT